MCIAGLINCINQDIYTVWNNKFNTYFELNIKISLISWKNEIQIIIITIVFKTQKHSIILEKWETNLTPIFEAVIRSDNSETRKFHDKVKRTHI